MTKSKQNNKVARRANGWGVDLNYEDAFGEWHDVSEETIRAIMRAMDANGEAEAPPANHSLICLRAGAGRIVKGASGVRLESGERIVSGERLPADLPLGYHSLHFEDGREEARLIVSPGECYLPDDLKTWGWAVQLYGARSRESWGIGDFADLDRLARWSKQLGAGMLLLNPLSAATPITPQEPSPYFPTSRRFFNPLWIHIEWAPGAQGSDLESLARLGKELNHSRLIDRDRVFELKMEAMERLWDKFQANDAFTQFCREQGEDLDRFAVFCALAETHQSGWHSWPEEYRHPANPAVARFGRENQRRVEFHKWLQWLTDEQLARSSKHVALMQDLPIGVDPDGADAWGWQDVITSSAAVGAPPDEFNTRGQNWGLPPFIPHKLRAARYEPFIQTIRAAFRNGGGLRIDHVMGLFRLFWIPQGMTADRGAYIRYNADEMLAIVALESHRAKAYVVGEDLGTVEDEVREKLAAHRVLSYRLFWFEKEDPSTYPREALAAVTTHDLPTVAGLWTGSDLKKQQELDLHPNEKSTTEICDRLATAAVLAPSSKIEDVVADCYGLLARAPSRVLSAALDDAAAVEERPNIPATVSSQNPNWSIGLPMPIEDLMASQLPARIAAALSRPSSDRL